MATDMQFSFSYIHYLMEKRASYSMEEVKAKFVLTDRRQCQFQEHFCVLKPFITHCSISIWKIDIKVKNTDDYIFIKCLGFKLLFQHFLFFSFHLFCLLASCLYLSHQCDRVRVTRPTLSCSCTQS